MIDTYIKIPHSLLRLNDLSLIDKIVYAQICALHQEAGCYATNEWLQSHLNLSKSSVIRALNNLEKSGYIKRHFRNSKRTTLTVNLAKFNKIFRNTEEEKGGG